MAEKRKVFEEVGAELKINRTPKGGMIDAGARPGRGAVQMWLMLIFVLVVAMIVIGGLTRLTDSGLSITEWAPISGALPPLSAAAWGEAFAKYQASPEYQLQNKGMSLEAFQNIYWWEWGHRQLGRVIGLVWAIGFFFLLITRRIPKGWIVKLLGLGALGGLQGAIGWWMVSSGLTGRMVDVASYRLAIHLGLAFIILGFTANYIMLLSRTDAALLLVRRSREDKLLNTASGLMHLTFLQIILGALVAGIDAGRSFPTWPLMGESFLPPDLFYVAGGGPFWFAFFENDGLVQFMHRITGYLLFAYVTIAWLRGRSSPQQATAKAFGWLMVAAITQVGLGIATVLNGAPLDLGLAHQLVAVALWVLIIRARHLAAFPKIQSIRGNK